jgi:hypothetical protein
MQKPVLRNQYSLMSLISPERKTNIPLPHIQNRNLSDFIINDGIDLRLRFFLLFIQNTKTSILNF